MADAAITGADHRTAASAVGPVEMRFGGYLDSAAGDEAKALATFGLDFGATAADDKLKASHRLECPALDVETGGGIRIKGDTAGTYCELAYDETTDRFTIKRYMQGAVTKTSTVSFGD